MPVVSPELELDSGGTSSTPQAKAVRRSKHKKHDDGKRRRTKRDGALLTWKEQLGQLLAIVATAAAVYYVTESSIGWLKEARRPFCDNLDPEQATSDDCRPCPENGRCQDGKLHCLPGYNVQGRLCVSDKQIDQGAQRLARFVQNKVCRIAGQLVCDGAGAQWVTEDGLWDTSMEEKMGLDAQNVWLVHEKALDIVRDILYVRIDDYGMREIQCPTELAKTYRPISCRIRQGIEANIYAVFLSGFIVVCLALYLYRHLRHRRLLARAEELYLQVCEVLGEKAMGTIDDTKWVVASRLRDHLLLPSERKSVALALWKEVEGLVQEDSRIDQYPKLVKGESRIVWEWQVEGALRTPKSTRRKKAVVSPSPLFQ